MERRRNGADGWGSADAPRQSRLGFPGHLLSLIAMERNPGALNLVSQSRKEGRGDEGGGIDYPVKGRG